MFFPQTSSQILDSKLNLFQKPNSSIIPHLLFYKLFQRFPKHFRPLYIPLEKSEREFQYSRKLLCAKLGYS